MKSTNQKQSGFTLIELLIYISITAVAAMVFTAFTADVIKNATQVLAAKEVRQNARFIINQIDQAAKTAAEIVSVTADQLTLEDQAGQTIIFYLNPTEQAVYYNNGTVDQAISNAAIKVTSLEFTSNSASSIHVKLIVEAKNPSGTPAGKYEFKLASTVVARPLIY